LYPYPLSFWHCCLPSAADQLKILAMPLVQALRPQLRERFLLVLVQLEAQGTIKRGTPTIRKLILVQTSMEPRARALTNAIPPRRRIPEISYSRGLFL
jgi:hypothetical protein